MIKLKNPDDIRERIQALGGPSMLGRRIGVTRQRVWLNVGLGIAVMLLLSGCADNMSFAAATVREPVGFWYGLWHGMISPISWLISLFSDEVTIYAIYNNGGWYDFGFILGIGALGSSIHVD